MWTTFTASIFFKCFNICGAFQIVAARSHFCHLLVRFSRLHNLLPFCNFALIIMICHLLILLTIIWLRRYPTTLSMLFGIHVSCTHKIIHKFIKILHAYLVPKYVRWHSMNTWRRLAGIFPDCPRVVAIVDGTPFWISKPKGKHLCFYSQVLCVSCIRHTSEIFVEQSYPQSIQNF